MSDVSEGCNHVMKGGPRKGSECGRSIHMGNACWHHDLRTVASRNLRNREIAAANRAVAETSIVDRDEYVDALYDEVAGLTGEMKSIGGWGSKSHGEFHTIRKRWRDVVSKISAAQFGMILSTYKRMSKRAWEYSTDGPLGKCPTEECECMAADGKYPKVRGRVTSDFGHYFSDEDCSDGSDCEHEDVHDCSIPKPIPTVGETVGACVDLEWDIHTMCRTIADTDMTDTENIVRYRSLRVGLHKMLDRLSKLESQ